MFHGLPTKNGTGISIFGDYENLYLLHQLAHDVAESLNESHLSQKAQHKLLMNFAYEVRKAYSGSRLKESFTLPDNQEIFYYGVQFVWTDVLIFTNALRNNVGFIRTSRRDQAILYALEYAIEVALRRYDAVGAEETQCLIGQGINTEDVYSFQIYQAVHIDFVSAKPGKNRFRKIRQLLSQYFSPWSDDYIGLIASFEASAKEQACEPTDLEFDDFPEILW